MRTRKRIPDADRRLRLWARHHLAEDAGARSVVEAARDLVGLHGTDPTSVYLQAWARVPRLAIADVVSALYEERSILRILGMRRTLFIVPLDLVPVVQGACAESIAKGQRPRLLRMLREAGIATDPEAWLEEVEARTVEVLERRGEATAVELAKEVPELREQIPLGAGTKWEGTAGVSTRLLFLLATEGRIVRGRPRGGITSSQYRWTPFDRWIPGGIVRPGVEEAQAELVRRYLGAFGPARLDDVKWWTGWTVAETRRAIAAVDAIGVDLDDGATGYVLAGDAASDGDDPLASAGPSIALLPPLDASIMGWTDRRFFLGEHRAALFDRAGNAGPSVWQDGRVVGGWGVRRDGEVVWRLLEDVGAEATRMIEERAAALGSWLGPLHFFPRFRTPLERELAG